jgi:hypothetical protein
MVQLSATRRSCIAVLLVSLVSFHAVTLFVTSQRVFIVVSIYFVTTQSGNFWIHPRICRPTVSQLLHRFLRYTSRCIWMCVSHGSSVNIVTRLEDGRPEFDPRQGQGIFLFFSVFRPALRPVQLPIQWVLGALSLGVKRPWRESDHSSSSSTEAENAWSYTSTPIRLHGVVHN